MLDIGFVVQGDKENFDPFKNQPLNALYFVTILNDHWGREDVSIVDLRSIDESKRIFHITEKDVYLYSVAAVNFCETRDIVKELREVYPKSKHFGGGVQVNVNPSLAQGVFDSIGLGDGEHILIQMLEDYSNGKLKKIYTEPRKIDINKFPYPDRKYLPKSSISLKGYLKQKEELLGTCALFSRGCPHNCAFCANLAPSKTQYRTPELIKEETAYLKREYNVQALAIKDDQFIPINRKVAINTLEAIAESGVSWRCQSRIFNIDDDIVALARDAGCTEVAIGVESVSQTALDAINKKITVEMAEEFIRKFNANEIDTRLHFIMGLPGEPKDIAQQTIKFIQKHKPSSVLFTLLAPTPGSDIYEHSERFGIELQDYALEKAFPVSGRFNEDEKTQLTFEYKKQTPFGASLTNDQILSNHREVLQFLWNNGLNF